MEAAKQGSARTRLSAVYLTSDERDLVMNALLVLYESLLPGAAEPHSLSRQTKFARAFTAKRISAVRDLFRDKQGSAA